MQVAELQTQEQNPDAERGMLVAVMREDSGELMAMRRFDTYLPGADKGTAFVRVLTR